MANNKRNQPDPVEAAFEQLGKKRHFNVRDLVRFDKRAFIVQSYIFEAERNGEYMLEEITYHLEPVFPRDRYDFGVACDDELEFLADASAADDYIANSPREEGDLPDDENEGGGFTVMFQMPYGDDDLPKPRDKKPQPTAEQIERKRRADYRAWIDARLDEVNELRANGRLTEADAVMREIDVRAVIHEAGGSVEENTEAGENQTEGDTK